MSDDLCPVLGISLGDLLLQGLLIGVLCEGCKKGSRTFRAGCVFGEHLEKKRNGQGKKLLKLFGAKACFFGQCIERCAAEKRLEQNTEKIHGFYSLR